MADLGFVSGMFVQPSLSSGFAGERVAGSRQSNSSSTVTMRVDAFQRNYQSFGKVNVDYTLGKRPYEYTRKGSPADLLDYPPGPEWAGVHSLTLCNKRPGISSVMAKADEFLAKAVLARDMVNNCKYGELNTYGSYCHDGQSKFEAERKRGAMRTASFKEAQKPVNIRLNQIYSSRKAAFASTGPTTWRDLYCAQGIRNKVENNLPTRNPGDSINIMKQMTPQEYLDSFKKSANYMGKSKAAMLEYPFSPAYAGIYAISSCNKNPGVKQIMSKADEHIARMRQMEANSENAPNGVYDTYGSYCHDGIAKGQAEEIRVAQRTASYRECLKSTFTKKNQEYEARKTAFAADGPSTYKEIYSAMPMVNKVKASLPTVKSSDPNNMMRQMTAQEYYDSFKQGINFIGKSTASMLEYPFSPAYAGIYAISSCNKNPSLKQTMAKADEYIAKMRQMEANGANAPGGVYDTYGSFCHDGVAKGQSEDIRVAQRTASYRECLKDTLTKKNQEFEARKAVFAAAGPSTDGEMYANMPMVNKVTTSMSSADSTASSQQYYESFQMSGVEAGQALYDSYRNAGQEYYESFRSGMPVAKPTWASSGVASKAAPPAPKPAAKAPEPEESAE